MECMAGTTGLEPATSAVTGQRSDQLSYVPKQLRRSAGDRWAGLLHGARALTGHSHIARTASSVTEPAGRRRNRCRFLRCQFSVVSLPAFRVKNARRRAARFGKPPATTGQKTGRTKGSMRSRRRGGLRGRFRPQSPYPMRCRVRTGAGGWQSRVAFAR